MEKLLIVFLACTAGALVVYTLLRALTVADKVRAYKREKARLSAQKPRHTYAVRIVQQGGQVRVESDARIDPAEDAAEG